MAPVPDSLPQFFYIEGLRIAAGATGSSYAGRDDLVVFGFPAGSSCAACFTKNGFAAAPVQLAKKRLAKSAHPRFWVINAGNANAATGQQGMENADTLCGYVADRFACTSDQVIPFSTGVIGQQLALDGKENAFSRNIAQMDAGGNSTSHWQRAARAIMTTDTVPKGVSIQVPVNNDSFVIGGIAKGSGMVCPDMATMLAFIVTDLAVSSPLLQKLLHECVDSSFHAISVDGDTSTNDAVALAATGTSQLPPIDGDSSVIDSFREHLHSACGALAQMIVRDGEGITRLIHICVEQAADAAEARRIARQVAHSPLVKTALFAGDPNWGRIACAIGNAGMENLDVSKVEIWADELCIMRGGVQDPHYTEALGQACFARSEIQLRLVIGRGVAGYAMYTTDLSHDYVSINSDYRS